MRTLLAILILTSTASAEIIIDDFTVPQRLELPAGANNIEEVSGVGSLLADRYVNVIASQTSANGFVDIGQANPYAATIQIPMTANNRAEPVLAVNMGWTYGSDLGPWADFGENNAVFVRFERFTAATPITGLQLIVTDGVNLSSYSLRTPVEFSDQAFEVAFPFDLLSPYRGAPRKEFDFSTVAHLSLGIDVAVLDPSLPEQLELDVVIDSVRVGRLVPEPSSLVLALALLIGCSFQNGVRLWCARFRACFSPRCR